MNSTALSAAQARAMTASGWGTDPDGLVWVQPTQQVGWGHSGSVMGGIAAQSRTTGGPVQVRAGDFAPHPIMDRISSRCDGSAAGIGACDLMMAPDSPHRPLPNDGRPW